MQNRVMVRHVSHQGHEMNHNQMTVVARGTILVDSVYVMHISVELRYISSVLSLSRGVRKQSVLILSHTGQERSQLPHLT